MATKNDKRYPRQTDGEPQGRHMTGFKGTKAVGGGCQCGGCHPNAKANHGRPVVMVNGKLRRG